MAEFGTADIPLENVAPKYFGMEYKKAAQKAALQELPVPVFRSESQRSKWLVSAVDLAAYLDRKNNEAKKQWQAMNG